METTFADRLTVTRNRPAGFDWLRIGLATNVVAWHTVHISYGTQFERELYQSSFCRPLIACLLAMFFTLSGFLVSGSLERCRTMVSFVGLRVMRIFPALVVEVALSACVLGPIFTHYGIQAYFSDGEFHDYLLNMVGIVHFALPGMFIDNPLPAIVNGQLWTVPFELRCYEVLGVISVLTLYRRRYLLLLSWAVCLTYVIATECTGDCALRGPLSGNQLVLSFLAGAVLFRFRASIPWNRSLCIIGCGLAWILLVAGGPADSLATLPIAYVTVYFGLCNPPRVKYIFSGDYSYGIFLYGFPVQQVVASFGPSWQHWWINLAVALPATALIAVGSWWLIERPVVMRKDLLLRLEAGLVGLCRRSATSPGVRVSP